MTLPFCFVLMPFGNKESSGILINFDSIYKEVIKPSLLDAGLEPIRADEEIAGGIIYKPMFERLMLCDYAICDLTTANANVFYELGIRHAIRPYSTVLIYAKRNQLRCFVNQINQLDLKQFLHMFIEHKYIAI